MRAWDHYSQYAAAVDALKDMGRLIDEHREWRRLGLARQTVGELFDLALAGHTTTKNQALKLAMTLEDQAPTVPLVLLRTAMQAAGQGGRPAPPETAAPLSARIRASDSSSKDESSRTATLPAHSRS